VGKLSGFLVIVLALMSCATYRSNPLVMTRAALNDGMVLVLHRSVEIGAERTSVIIQGGEVISGGRNRYAPFCELVVNSLAEVPQLIEPDVFRIKRVGGETRYADSRQHGPLQLAALDAYVRLASGSLPPDVTETWRLSLYSERQPDVILLVCGGVERNMGEQVDPPTLAQIRASLGAVAQLRPVGRN
jgi:hypothetical protein